MTHIPGMPISYDEPSEWKKSRGTCPKCGKDELMYRIHESSCGGYEDAQYKCSSCKHSYWVDGPDA